MWICRSDNAVREHLGDRNESQASDWRRGAAGADDLQERLQQARRIEVMDIFAALQIYAQLRECAHEGVVLHALAFAASQTPSRGEGRVGIVGDIDGRAGAVWPAGIGGCEARRGRRGTQNGGDGAVGPASVLAHSGGDSDAFCDDERDWVDRDGDRPRAARYREVHVGHGGGGSGGGVWQERSTLSVGISIYVRARRMQGS
jgi:hypothetical protein